MQLHTFMFDATAFMPSHFCLSGVDLAYDGIGGKLLDDIADNIAVCGKIISTGFVSQYQGGKMKAASFEPTEGVSPNAAVLPVKLLLKVRETQGTEIGMLRNILVGLPHRILADSLRRTLRVHF